MRPQRTLWMLTLIGILALSVCPIAAARAAEKGDTAAIEAGAELRVVNGPAPVKLGEETLATLPAGTELKAIKVRDPWVQVWVTSKGERLSGWIHKRHLEVLAPKVTKPEQKADSEALPPAKPATKQALFLDQQVLTRFLVAAADQDVAGYSQSGPVPQALADVVGKELTPRSKVGVGLPKVIAAAKEHATGTFSIDVHCLMGTKQSVVV